MGGFFYINVIVNFIASKKQNHTLCILFVAADVNLHLFFGFRHVVLLDLAYKNPLSLRKDEGHCGLSQWKRSG